MRYETQQLFDKGFTSLAYLIESMWDKAPELNNDFDNMFSLLHDAFVDFELRIDDAYSDGYGNGQEESEWDHLHETDTAYEDGRQEGYEDGFQDGLQEGMSSQGYQD